MLNSAFFSSFPIKGNNRKRMFFARHPPTFSQNVRVCSGWAPAHAVGLAVPPAPPVARVWLVPSSIGKGFARLVPRPLPFAPSLAPSAPSASVSRGSPSGFRLALIACAVPSSIRPSLPRPAVPPCASPLTASAPRGGAFAPRFQSWRSLVAFRPPALAPKGA